jgi:hypothetical protein
MSMRRCPIALVSIDQHRGQRPMPREGSNLVEPNAGPLTFLDGGRNRRMPQPVVVDAAADAVARSIGAVKATVPLVSPT